MKKKHYYSHIIDIQSIHIEIDGMDLNDKEKEELFDLIEKSMHHKVTHTVLDHLSEEDRKLFLKHIALEEHDSLWDLLREKVSNVEEKVKFAGEKLLIGILEDITESKKKKD